MQNLFRITISFFLLLSVISPLNAQDYTNDQAPEIQDTEGLRAEFKQYTQDPASKEVKFEMILKSNLDSDRVRITWTLTPLQGKGSVFKDTTAASSSLTIVKGQTYTVPITIIPAGEGATELFGKVESFKAGATFTVTVKKIFGTNSSQEVLPITQEYASARTLNLVKNVVIIVVILALIVFGGMVGLKRFKKWLDKE